MSGGYFGYANDYACNRIYRGLDAVYGQHKQESKEARSLDPLEDKVISELTFDVFCLIHSYDYYVSCDISEETYRKDVESFKRKWLKFPSKAKIRAVVDEELEHTRKELYKMYQL